MTKPESKDYQWGVHYKKALAVYYEYLDNRNKELTLCLENSTSIMEEQEGEVMDLVICQTMNHQIKRNRKSLKK